MTDPDRVRTRPWALDEYLFVNGHRLVYSADKKRGIYAVHLPGRRTTTVAALRSAGHGVVMPKRVRHGP